MYYRTLCLEYKKDSKKLWSLINKISGKINNKVELIDKLKLIIYMNTTKN